MLITDYLFENVKPIWDAYLEHDFIMDMEMEIYARINLKII